MHRRQFLRGSLGAALVGPLFVDEVVAQGRGQAPAATAAAPRPAPSAPRKLILDAHSRNLQWLRSADDVAEAAVEMVCGGVCVTVQPRPGHVDPAKVAAGAARVREDRAQPRPARDPDQGAGDHRSRRAARWKRIVGTAAQNGITHYSLGAYTYDFKTPLAPQLEAIKLRLDKFVRLNQKHRITLVYDTVARCDVGRRRRSSTCCRS